MKYWRRYRRDEIYRRETRFAWMHGAFVLKNGGSPVQLGLAELGRFCNKPATFYREQSTRWKGKCLGLISGCVYEEWFWCHDGDPDSEFGRFFASSVQIAAGGSKTVAGILEVHKSLCDQAASRLAEIASDEAEGVLSEGNLARLTNSQHYSPHPVCCAIVVIIDQLNLDTGLERGITVLHNNHSDKAS